MIRWYVVAGIAIALVFAWFGFDEDKPPPTLPPELSEEPDFYVENAEIKQFRPDGSLEYALRSKSITHFEAEQLTRMAQPEMRLFQNEGPPWQVASRFGYIRPRARAGATEEQVYLREQVTLDRRLDDGRFVRVRTEALYVYPGRRYAETDQAVMIETETSRTRAVGFEADLTRGWMKLSSSPQQRVHIIVLPQALE